MEDVRQFGKYQLVRSLATGGMGEVFLAIQQGPAGFMRTVVLKRILKHLANDSAFVEQFLNEGRLAALLTHPNIVQIVELGEVDGGYFLAMEYIHGRTLRATLNEFSERGLRFPQSLGAWVVAQALHGLHYAHQLRSSNGARAGVVHRDVSPDNLMLGFEGGVKLLDFGIAKARGFISNTQPGTLKGKLPYMAPELLLGEQATPATDQYSVGVMLFELLSGQRPFAAPSDLEFISRVTTEEPPLLSAIAPDVPRSLVDLTARALARIPEERFASAGEMADALEHFAASSSAPVGQAALARELKLLYGEVPAETPTSIQQIPLEEVVVTRTFQRAVAEFPDSQATLRDAPRVVTTTPSSHPTLADAPAITTTVAALTLADAPSVLTTTTSAPTLAAARRGRLWRRLTAAGLGLGAAALLGLLAVLMAPASSPAPLVGPETTLSVPDAAVELGAVELAAAEEPADAGALASVDDPDGADEASQESEEAPGVEASSASEPPRAKVRPKRPGSVLLQVRPWAEVYVRGKSLGVTPMDPFVLPSGTQTLVLKNPALKVERRVSVKVKPGVQTLVQITLD